MQFIICQIIFSLIDKFYHQVLTQSEIELLRQDLKESMAYLINKAKKVYASHETQEVKC